MNKKIITVVIVSIMLFFVGYRFFTTKNAEKNQQESIKQSMTANVELMKPFEIEVSSEITAPGRVSAIKYSDVVARTQGYILKQHFKDGDFVRQGQLLYTIDPAQYNIALDRAKANLESAKANQYQAQKEFERARELVEKDFVSKSAYDEALARKDAANAAVHSANAAINDARRLLSYTSITAPITGKIGSAIVTVGNYLSSPNTVLAKIVSVDPIYVQYSLDSSIFSQLKNDEIIPNTNQKAPIKVEVTLSDGTLYNKTGNADFQDNTVSESTGSIMLRATFPNPNGVLIPGDFVSVKVYSNKKITRLAVPQSSVMQDGEGKYLFIVDENNVAHKRKIVTDGEKDDNWLIVSGIEKDERFASSGVIKVRDNAPVNVINKENTKE